MFPPPSAAAQAQAELSLAARALFDLIAGLSRQRGFCWASQANLASRLGRSQRSVRGYIAELELAGVLRVERTTTRRTNLYYPLVRKIERQPIATHPAMGCHPPGNGLPVGWQRAAGSVAKIAANTLRDSIQIEASAAQTPPSSAAAAAADVPISQEDNQPQAEGATFEALAVFKAIGIVSGVLNVAAGVEPELALCAALWLKRELSRPKNAIKDRTRFALGIFKMPRKYGFEHAGGKWLPPDRAELELAQARQQLGRDRRQDDAGELVARRVAEAWYAAWKAKWDELPAAAQEAIEAQAQADLPLFSRFPKNSYTRLSVCLRILEAQAQAGADQSGGALPPPDTS